MKKFPRTLLKTFALACVTVFSMVASLIAISASLTTGLCWYRLCWYQ